MTISHRLVVAAAVLSVSALSAQAQDLPMALSHAVGCAPQVAGVVAPADAPRIVGAQDTSPRTLYGPRDLVIVDVGTAGGVRVGQRFYLRRQILARYNVGTQALITSGRLSIVAASDDTAIGQIDVACDGIHAGDYLEPWVAPVIPPGADRTDASGDLDFGSPSRVLFGDYGRESGANGDLMLADLGQNTAPGARYAVYRDLLVPGVPLAAVGEAVVISVGEHASLLRLTEVRDAVNAGDLLIPRRR